MFPGWPWRLSSRARARLRWFIPGLGIKRWFVLLWAGAIGMTIGLDEAAQTVFHLPSFTAWASAALLFFLPPLARALVWMLVGGGLMLWAARQIKHVLVAPFAPPGQSVSQLMSDYRRRGKGPKIVAIGGGTGLSTLLRGLKHYTANITAIVTVADDGGSSGRLRRTLGVLPPGDFRNCIAALADDESLITQLFQYRFGGDLRDLGGHSFGNLFISAMAEVTGSFEQALLESSRVLTIRGQVVPSTLTDVTLVGELMNDDARVSRVAGESQIPEQGGVIRRVFLEPGHASAYPGAIRAILEAELIVLGPGSLYTSLIPNLLVHDLAEAIAASRARKVYVCNTATQPGETDGYTVTEHVEAIERHTHLELFLTVLANHRREGQLLPHLKWVEADPDANGRHQYVLADLIDEAHPWRHDSEKLARALLNLLHQTDEATLEPDLQASLSN